MQQLGPFLNTLNVNVDMYNHLSTILKSKEIKSKLKNRWVAERMGEDLVDEFRRSGVMMNEKKRKRSVILNNRLMQLDQSLSTSPQVSLS